MAPSKKRGRSIYYTPDVYAGLKEVWIAANSCCGELLHPMVREYVAIFKRDKMWEHGLARCHLASPLASPF